MEFRGRSYSVEEATVDSFEGGRFRLFSAGASRSKSLVPSAMGAGSCAIDNSSAFRMDPSVPLVVPEVNGSEIVPSQKLYAVDCTAIILVVATNPLRKLGNIERLIVSTYQSASGGGPA